MNVTLTTYNASGQFLVQKLLQEEVLEFMDEPYLLGLWDPATARVVDGEAVQRPPNPTVLVGIELHNVPLPSTVVIEGERYPVYDHIVLLSLPPGTHSVTVESFPYLDATFEVIA